MEIAFFFIGLGFFIYVICIIERAEERVYQRKLNEAREFGFEKRRRRLDKELRDLSK